MRRWCSCSRTWTFPTIGSQRPPAVASPSLVEDVPTSAPTRRAPPDCATSQADGRRLTRRRRRRRAPPHRAAAPRTRARQRRGRRAAARSGATGFPVPGCVAPPVGHQPERAPADETSHLPSEMASASPPPPELYELASRLHSSRATSSPPDGWEAQIAPALETGSGSSLEGTLSADAVSAVWGYDRSHERGAAGLERASSVDLDAASSLPPSSTPAITPARSRPAAAAGAAGAEPAGARTGGAGRRARRLLARQPVQPLGGSATSEVLGLRSGAEARQQYHSERALARNASQRAAAVQHTGGGSASTTHRPPLPPPTAPISADTISAPPPRARAHPSPARSASPRSLPKPTPASEALPPTHSTARVRRPLPTPTHAPPHMRPAPSPGPNLSQATHVPSPSPSPQPQPCPDLSQARHVPQPRCVTVSLASDASAAASNPIGAHAPAPPRARPTRPTIRGHPSR